MVPSGNVVRLLALAIFIVAGNIAGAEEVGWRNDGTGRFAVSDPPRQWSSEENVAWKVKLPGVSLASPVVVGERVFVTANPSELLCFSASDGQLLWSRSHGYADVFDRDKAAGIERDHRQARELQKQVGELHKQRGEAEKAGNAEQKNQLQEQISELEQRIRQLREFPPAADGQPGNSGPTPVSDGRNVYALFGNGIVSSHTLDGKQNWMIFAEAGGGDQTASPLLVDGKLVIHLRRLIALEADTGAAVWRTETPVRHGTPVVAALDETPVVITPAGAVIDLSDGAILARDQFRLGHCSPLIHHNVLYAMEDGSLKALRLSLADEPDSQGGLEVLWKVDGSRTNRLASPVYHEGLLYGITEQGILEVTDAKSGEQIYRKRLRFEGRADPSICLAGDLIYMSSNRGTTIVLRGGREYEEIARNELEDFSSSLAFAGSRVYVRTKNHLWCIGK